MAKTYMDFDTERAMRKELDSLVERLLDDVEIGREDEESAQAELAKFRERYHFSEKLFKPHLDSSLQRIQAKRMQKKNITAEEDGESFTDSWPPQEPDVSNKGGKKG